MPSVLLALATSFAAGCHNSGDVERIRTLEKQSAQRTTELEIAKKKVAELEQQLGEMRKRSETPSRADLEGILNGAAVFCCRRESQFDSVLIGNLDDVARKLVESNLAIIRNGRVWPATPRDERWIPNGRYDAKDGWPPEDATNVFWWVRPADRKVAAVTGVSRTDENTAIADFDWQWSRNAVGDALGRGALWMDDTYHARATLRLFDDGWRVDRVELGQRRF